MACNVLGPIVSVHFKEFRWQPDVAQPQLATTLQLQHSLPLA